MSRSRSSRNSTCDGSLYDNLAVQPRGSDSFLVVGSALLGEGVVEGVRGRRVVVPAVGHAEYPKMSAPIRVIFDRIGAI